MTKLSIVIPHRSNDAVLLKRCLASMAVCNEVEIIVVDSSDNFDVEEFKKFPIKLIHSEKPLSCGTARNIGVSLAAGKYIWCVDADDTITPDALQKLLDAFESDKDMYYLPWLPYSQKSYGAFIPNSFEDLCKVNVAAWNKAYKRELYVPFPDYHPEDVAAHYKLLDKAKSFASLSETMYMYDDINPQAYSRTYDYLKVHPQNLISLAADDTLTSMGMRDEAIAGCLKTAADLYTFVHEAKKPEVKAAAMQRLKTTWMNISAGYYIH